eukprot:GDKI01038948.1.p3 GENE.GDKI01038948.1~~GDKI01038948.1.p3  ORF type:complete len:108 (+),score=19.12 GDKI01038948.1:255-578(+)
MCTRCSSSIPLDESPMQTCVCSTHTCIHTKKIKRPVIQRTQDTHTRTHIPRCNQNGRYTTAAWHTQRSLNYTLYLVRGERDSLRGVSPLCVALSESSALAASAELSV